MSDLEDLFSCLNQPDFKSPNLNRKGEKTFELRTESWWMFTPSEYYQLWVTAEGKQSYVATKKKLGQEFCFPADLQPDDGEVVCDPISPRSQKLGLIWYPFPKNTRVDFSMDHAAYYEAFDWMTVAAISSVLKEVIEHRVNTVGFNGNIRVVDACCGIGSATVHFDRTLPNYVSFLSFDVSKSRMEKTRSNVEHARVIREQFLGSQQCREIVYESNDIKDLHLDRADFNLLIVSPPWGGHRCYDAPFNTSNCPIIRCVIASDADYVLLQLPKNTNLGDLVDLLGDEVITNSKKWKVTIAACVVRPVTDDLIIKFDHKELPMEMKEISSATICTGSTDRDDLKIPREESAINNNNFTLVEEENANPRVFILRETMVQLQNSLVNSFSVVDNTTYNTSIGCLIVTLEKIKGTELL